MYFHASPVVGIKVLEPEFQAAEYRRIERAIKGISFGAVQIYYIKFKIREVEPRVHDMRQNTNDQSRNKSVFC